VTYQSSVPAAIAGLAAAFRASTGLGLATPPVPVRDGPALTDAAGLEAVAVGYSGDQNTDSAAGAATPEGLSGTQDRERYTVTCAAEVIDPGADITAARTRVYQLHAACGAAIAADRTLGRVVLRAVPGPWTLRQQQTPNGALARIVFGVTIDAYTTR
jgi:hypothetical protein